MSEVHMFVSVFGYVCVYELCMSLCMSLCIFSVSNDLLMSFATLIVHAGGCF